MKRLQPVIWMKGTMLSPQYLQTVSLAHLSHCVARISSTLILPVNAGMIGTYHAISVNGCVEIHQSRFFSLPTLTELPSTNRC